jgi:hypothetical protein
MARRITIDLLILSMTVYPYLATALTVAWRRISSIWCLMVLPRTR